MLRNGRESISTLAFAAPGVLADRSVDSNINDREGSSDEETGRYGSYDDNDKAKEADADWEYVGNADGQIAGESGHTAIEWGRPPSRTTVGVRR